MNFVSQAAGGDSREQKRGIVIFCPGHWFTLVRQADNRDEQVECSFAWPERILDKDSFTGLGMKKQTKQERHFAVCINNKKYKASLEVGKLYRIIPDEEAESLGYLRVVDESGDAYGYSADRFFRLEVLRPLERSLLSAWS
jgi:hypothetical protein